MRIKKGAVSLFMLLSVAGLLFMTGCLDKNNMSKAEVKMIDTYLKGLGDTVVVHKPSGLYYIELIAGTGRSPVDNDTVTIRGRGLYLDYVEFSSSLSNTTPEVFVLGRGYKIEGIEEGLKYMKAGGKSRLLTPSFLAYGFTPLLWEITLIKVSPGPVKK
jgi:FKBP-type peptidyl-prolyl cis-trans isomerase